ncbi:hypothetical protein QBC37DRAFT_332980 [Rhypophila decipiens]|uniref:Heterokaryon incompatibility domain-containing protein n=1 Tax=Rhypophila decipiens TaxID=261697 RepID=A0AAN7BD21_9PEZI|nr:hypothetical protein QBC37DRAFT_332980 [Rhypophila decipiens]
MPLLAEIARTEGDDSPFVNYVVVPSFAGRNLTERTCPHFDQWLANVSIKCSSPGRSWIYDHGLQLEGLESWDRYCTTGDELLEQLLVLQEKLCEDETIILIGHKLGCYILKKALITAWNNGHKDEYRQVLDMIETIMLIGEPSLNPKKPDEWIELISECISRKNGLPKKLATGFTVGCLQQISDKFEEILLFSTVFDVLSRQRPGLKRKFRMKKMEHDGCIGCATVNVRLFTTSSEESLLESGPGDASVCPFHPKSIHFQHLLTLNPAYPANLPQIEASGRSETVQDATRRVVSTSDTEVANDALSQLHPPHSPVSAFDIQEEGLPIVPTAQQQPTSSVRPSFEEVAESLFEQQDPVATPISTEQDAENTEICDTSAKPILPLLYESEIPRSSEDLEVSAQVATPESQTSSISDESHEPEPSRPRREYFSSFIPARDTSFYGHSVILDQLEELLLSPRIREVSMEAALDDPKKANLICLVGKAGIGKTSIANEFAYRFMYEFKFIIWLNARSEASLGKYCHDSAVALGLVNGRLSQDHIASRNTLFTFLKNARAPWLLVLDDCDEDMDISQYIPGDSTCSVIVTARSQPMLHSVRVWSVISIPGFTVEEGARFLINSLDAKITEEDADAICSVAVLYHTSPLVLQHVATWCNRESISIHQVKAVLGLDEISLVRRFELPIYTVTLSRMERLDICSSTLLAKLCFCDGSRIKERFVFSGQSRRLAILSRDRPWSENPISAASSVLYKLALVDVDESQPERIFYLHRSVQDAVRSRLDDGVWINSFRETCKSISCGWPSARKFKNIMAGFWEEFDDLHSHLIHLAFCLVRDRLEDRVIAFDPGEEFIRLLVHHTWYNSRRGNQSEDRGLHDLAQFLITTKQKPHNDDSRRTVPRRWLQVLDDENGYTTRLVDTSGLQDSPYIALSYQWGPSQLLTPSILNDYARISRGERQGLDLSVLPQQVSDAISFTRNMGYKYIWIDSVCMDTGDPMELSKELTRLPEYFSNSAMIFCSLGTGLSSGDRSSAGTQFKLNWQPSQRLDISSYSILRPAQSREYSSGIARLLEAQWLSVTTFKDKGLLTSTGFEDNGFRFRDIVDNDAIKTDTTDQPKSTATTLITTGLPTTSSSDTRNSKKQSRRPILRKRYGVWRYKRRNNTLKNPRRGLESRKLRVNQLVDLIITKFLMIMSGMLRQGQAVWRRARQALVHLHNENPNLRSYIFAVLLVTFSICLGNTMPKFVPVSQVSIWGQPRE